MRLGGWILGGALLVLALGSVWWLKLEPEGPQIEFVRLPELVGRTISGEVTVRTRGRPGLRWIEVNLLAGGQTVPLYREELVGETAHANERKVHFDADLSTTGLREGPAAIEVAADTYAWHLFGGNRGARATRDITVDLTPPRVDLLTTQHNMRLGGAALAVFTVTPDAVDAGVAVESYYFPAVRGYFADANAAFAVFAVPQDLSPQARPKVRATDAAGNATEVELPVAIKARHFPERQMAIDDVFLQRKVPEILSKVGRPVPADLREGYLIVNRDVRRESEEKIDAITAKSAPEPLWTGAFRRQSNAAPMSAFADRRFYVYKGETIDRQTHLGYDLASLKRAPVEATQTGTVVFAGYLGIYGDSVVIDHGLGVFSLYGHLSSIGVREGQTVQVGEPIGQTGESGLAGGDHLHFSIVLRGTHVDPVEWWDPLWMRDHIERPLASLPAAKAAQAAAPPAAEASDGEGQR
ncbi:MAG: M23 family metallopeptidase [Candidatus Binatia bacterium]